MPSSPAETQFHLTYRVFLIPATVSSWKIHLPIRLGFQLFLDEYSQIRKLLRTECRIVRLGLRVGGSNVGLLFDPLYIFLGSFQGRVEPCKSLQVTPDLTQDLNNAQNFSCVLKSWRHNASMFPAIILKWTWNKDSYSQNQDKNLQSIVIETYCHYSLMQPWKMRGDNCCRQFVSENPTVAIKKPVF